MSSILEIRDLGVQPYEPIAEYQKKLVEQVYENKISDTLILLEHEPVYTLGRNADASNIILPKEDLAQKGITIAETSRGGDVTFHGPGQLVGYPIIRLPKGTKSVLWYVEKLEHVIIKTLKHFGIEAVTDKKNRGVWVGNDKIAALGVRITKQITMHGFALNVSPDLQNYKGIIPCGIKDKGVTSLEQLGVNASMSETKGKVIENFKEVFEYEEIKHVTKKA